MEATIINSSIEVICNLSSFDMSMAGTLCARAGNLVRAFSDAVSFATTIGFVIVWDSLKQDDDPPLEIQHANPALVGLCKSYKFPPTSLVENTEFENVLKLILRDPNLLGSLTDLMDTLSFHHQTPTNCGRVLDSLRRAVAPNVEVKPGWAILQSLLRISRSYQEWVTDQAKDTRHGDRESDIPAETILEISKRTWEIVDRFIEFRKRGSVQLPEDEFPVLAGQ